MNAQAQYRDHVVSCREDLSVAFIRFYSFIKLSFIYNLDGQRTDFTAVEMCSSPGKL